MEHRGIIPMSDESEHIKPTDLARIGVAEAFFASDEAQAIASFSLPGFSELPDLELYRDQVTVFVERTLSPLDPSGATQWLTPSMVNNYVKAGLIAPPTKKLYNREHVARLLIICIFKQMLPIADIDRLFRIQRMTYPFDVAYNYVTTQVNGTIHSAFTDGAIDYADTASKITRETMLVRSVATAFASKLFLMAYLRYAGYEG